MRLSLLAILLLAAPVLAQRDARVPDPDPELERKTFVLPPGFEVNLFASDPLLAKPIQMNFDPHGRLWVVSSETYPQVKPGVAPDDKVLILEDTAGKGVADKTTVFARGLLIPTGVAPGDGGAYVAAGTELLHFSDPDPATGAARKKRVVLSGFGTEDTHHLLHTLKWGPDGGLYMNQSVYIHSHIETADGVKRLNAGGVWRFEPKTGKLEVYCRGLWNPWGTAWDKWGRGFLTDGAGFTGINMLWRGAEYEAGYKVTRPLPGLNPGSPKLCGLAVLSGRHLPPEYDGSLVANDFRGHRVCRYVVTEDGAGFVSREQPELIKSDHPAFRPIDVCMGPDGAVYVADWYNPIIQHGEVDFRDPRRDKTHGRIWRITAKGRPLVSRPRLLGGYSIDLPKRLSEPEQWTRDQTRRVMQEGGWKEFSTSVEVYAGGLARSAAGDHDRAEAMWALEAMDIGTSRLEGLAKAEDPRARAVACRIAGDWSGKPWKTLGVAIGLVADPDPQVRREAVLALSRSDAVEAAVAATKVLDHPMDKWLDYALWLTLRELAPHWLPEVQAGKLDFDSDPKKLVFALQAAGTADVAGPLRKLLDGGKLTAERQMEVLLALAKHGGPADLGRVLAASYGKDVSPPVAAKQLAAVEDAVRLRKVGPPPDLATSGFLSLAELLDGGTGPARQSAIRLAGLWKVEALRDGLELLAAGKRASDADRRAALDALVSLGGAKSVAFLSQFRVSDSNRQRAWFAAALSRLDLIGAAGRAAGLFDALDPADVSELVAVFAERKGGLVTLAGKLQAVSLKADVARAGVRAARAAGKDGEALVAVFTKAGKLSDHKWAITGDELTKFLAELPKADPARGEAIYRRGELQCLKCHNIAGAGGLVGPEMTSLGGSAQPDYILESLLAPNAKVKEGFNALAVATEDGRQVTGVKVRESDTELVLRDAEGKLLTLPKADIASKKDAPSLMPAGLVDGLTRQELLDLVRFLSELGKGSYAAKPGRLVRAWETVDPKPVFGLLGRKGFGAVATEPGLTWSPVYSRVSGDLPLAELPQFWLDKAAPLAVARFTVERNTVGKLTLTLPDPTGLSLWVDGVPVAAAASVAVDVSAGPHVVTVGVELAKRATPLRVEVE